MLVRKNECMQTISARTINEIFSNNLIRLSISIHGGTSSLTYSYGTPNHIQNLNEKFKLPIKSKGNFKEVLEDYYSGKLDESREKSTISPDDKALAGRKIILL
jgi:hypothetical protein